MPNGVEMLGLVLGEGCLSYTFNFIGRIPNKSAVPLHSELINWKSPNIGRTLLVMTD